MWETEYYEATRKIYNVFWNYGILKLFLYLWKIYTYMKKNDQLNIWIYNKLFRILLEFNWIKLNWQIIFFYAHILNTWEEYINVNRKYEYV